MNIRTLLATQHTRYRFITSLPENAVVLDIGCGDGRFQRRLSQHRQDLSIISIDKYDFSANFPKNAFHLVDITRDAIPLTTDSVDAVFCAHVLEHVHSHDLLLTEIRRVLKSTGSIYIETPSTRSLFLPSPGFSCHQEGTFTFFDDPTHIRPFTRQGLYRIAKAIGCKNIQTGFARNWVYCFLSPFLIIYSILCNNRQVLATTLWSLTGWCVYIWGKEIKK